MPRIGKGTTSRNKVHLATLIGLVVVLYLVARWGSEAAALRAPVGPIWPAAGVALALVLRYGFRVWPLILLACAAAIWPTVAERTETWALAIIGTLLIGFSGAFESVLTGWGIRRLADHWYLHRAVHFLKASLIAVPAGAILATTIYLYGSTLVGLIPVTEWAELIGVWHGMIIADVIGMIVLAPPILIWLRRHRTRLELRRVPELLAYIALTAVAFGLHEQFNAAYLLFVAHIAIAIRMPRQWTALTVAVSSICLLWIAIRDIEVLHPVDVYSFFLSELSIVLILNLATYSIALLWREADLTREHLETRVAQRTHELEAANARLEALSHTDPLTGAWNRRYFEHRAERELERADRNGTTLGLLMLDIDRFKPINDDYGHPVGDRVLTALVDRLARELRPTDVLARIGGEEFAVLVPDCDKVYAREVAERLRAAVDRAPVITRDDLPLAVTVSIGIAVSCPAGGESTPFGERVTAMVNTADRNLYRAKQSGRNRIVGPKSGGGAPIHNH